MADLDPAVPPCLHLISAFLAMESTHFLISIARCCGGGFITERVQRFIWDHCFRNHVEKFHAPYVKNFIKKLISNVESERGVVLDELYEQYACYMTSMMNENVTREKSRVLKFISFIFPECSSGLSSCPNSMKLEVSLHSSLNMLEGDTGCSIWPSSLFMSEFVLACPELFHDKSCFELGSGVGLVGICLSHVKASKVMLTDGDMSTLANMKANLELNNLNVVTELSGSNTEDPNPVECIDLPWESALECELRDFKPDIILGADVIYDPLCLPHLIRVLSIMLDQTYGVKGERPIAYFTTMIRNMNTFNHFLALTRDAKLQVTDITEEFKPLNLLPYMQSYHRSNIRLLTISYARK